MKSKDYGQTLVGNETYEAYVAYKSEVSGKYEYKLLESENICYDDFSFNPLNTFKAKRYVQKCKLVI